MVEKEGKGCDLPTEVAGRRTSKSLQSPSDPAATVTSNVLTVSQLLTPLSRDEVKIVRCLGLNYADHAVSIGPCSRMISV